MAVNLDKKVFLVITDDPGKQKFFTTMIGKHLPESTVFTAPDVSMGTIKLRNAPPHVLIVDYDVPKIKDSQLIDSVLVDKKMKEVAILVADHLPEKEKYLDEMVIGKIQFCGKQDEDEFVHCLVRALNYSSHGKESEFYTRFLAKGDILIQEGAKADLVFIVRTGK